MVRKRTPWQIIYLPGFDHQNSDQIREGYCTYFSNASIDNDFREDEHPPFIRKRIRCPKCGRRLIVKAGFDHDNEIIYSMPIHKPKGYKKKPRKKSRDTRMKK